VLLIKFLVKLARRMTS